MDAREKAIEIERELEVMPVTGAYVYMVTLDRRDRYQTPGRVYITPRRYAARLRVEGTHGYASQEEILAYEKDSLSRQEEIIRQLRNEQQKFQLMLTPELIAAVAENNKGKK